MKIDLTNKTVLITGGSRGIGESCVRMFAETGANVVFTYVQAKKKAESIISELDGNIKALKVDMESPEDIEESVKLTVKEFGSIDVLVHNAGIWNDGEIEKMDLDHWKKLLRINLDSTFLFTKAVVPYMKKKNWGRIILVTSTAGQRGEAYHSHYAASKGGMISFTKSMAVELGKYGITTNSVAPGWVDTDMNIEVFKDMNLVEKIKNDIPIGRIASADDIAGPILFLATGLANHINGEILNVNGGSVLCG
ncbi:MAG: 3-oxoacyl-ACP reductase FabG [Melioribacteraceae bacterium]|nr:3-oxoacyl-ACP reductase FabG [Melioribacteraceae bacterium]MCO6474546.1 3-oxoacyl-ACP reductase FabG [Melioribacteraceae bacterium]MDD3557409.1 3-oxoacyl-ACP reductase FabG [Melioribacteraceae bacterium]